MRKTAFLSTLVVLLTLSLSNLSAQSYTYILYDANSMDRLDHQFLGTNSAALYTSYRLNKNTGEQIFLDIGIESPVIYKQEPPSMVYWQNANIDQNFVMGINTGNRKVFICKKLDSGWAVQAIGSGVYMSNIDRVLTVVTANYDFRADFKQTLGNNLSMNTHGLPSPTSVFYVGELQACNTIAQTFKVFPSETNKFETTITILPGLGMIRENAEACPTYELVAINGKDVCSYLGGNASPAPIQPEPIPETYAVVKPYIPVETGNVGEVYVRSKTIVENANITKSDRFDATPFDVPPSYNTPTNVPPSYNSVVNVPQTTFQTEKPVPAKVDCSVTALTGEHVVQNGENLYSISRRYGLSVNSLREWNNLSSDLLYPCGILRISAPVVETVEKPSMEVARTNDVPMSYNTVVKVTPKKVETPVITKVIECEVPYTEGEHVVLNGESLYAIARKYNVTYAQLKSWNKLTTDVIKPCQKLIVAAPKSAATTKTAVTSKSVDVPKQYDVVVKPKSATTKTTTKSAVYVKEGAGLHVVLSGETVALLAKQYRMTEADFRKINYLSDNEGVSIGQVVRTENCNCNIIEGEDHSLTLKSEPVRSDIPSGYNYVGSKTTTNDVVAKGTNRRYHVVQSAETLYTIARNYGKSMEEIRRLNNLTENEVIIPNQLIVLE
jgi:LysM repeat protein